MWKPLESHNKQFQATETSHWCKVLVLCAPACFVSLLPGSTVCVEDNEQIEQVVLSISHQTRVFTQAHYFDAGVKNSDARASNLTWHPMESTKKMVQLIADVASRVWSRVICVKTPERSSACEWKLRTEQQDLNALRRGRLSLLRLSTLIRTQPDSNNCQYRYSSVSQQVVCHLSFLKTEKVFLTCEWFGWCVLYHRQAAVFSCMVAMLNEREALWVRHIQVFGKQSATLETQTQINLFGMLWQSKVTFACPDCLLPCGHVEWAWGIMGSSHSGVGEESKQPTTLERQTQTKLLPHCESQKLRLSSRFLVVSFLLKLTL